MVYLTHYVCFMCFSYMTYGFIMRLIFSLGSVFLLPGTCFMPPCHLDLWQLKSCWLGLCSVFVGEKPQSWSGSILSVKAKLNVHRGEVSYCFAEQSQWFPHDIFFSQKIRIFKAVWLVLHLISIKTNWMHCAFPKGVLIDFSLFSTLIQMKKRHLLVLINLFVLMNFTDSSFHIALKFEVCCKAGTV